MIGRWPSSRAAPAPSPAGPVSRTTSRGCRPTAFTAPSPARRTNRSSTTGATRPNRAAPSRRRAGGAKEWLTPTAPESRDEGPPPISPQTAGSASLAARDPRPHAGRDRRRTAPSGNPTVLLVARQRDGVRARARRDRARLRRLCRRRRKGRGSSPPRAARPSRSSSRLPPPSADHRGCSSRAPRRPRTQRPLAAPPWPPFCMVVAANRPEIASGMHFG